MSLCRWLKYEERVEIGERWSKPHVSTTSLRGLHMFRDALNNKQCVVGLDETLSGGDFQVAGNNNNNNKLLLIIIMVIMITCKYILDPETGPKIVLVVVLVVLVVSPKTFSFRNRSLLNFSH